MHPFNKQQAQTTCQALFKALGTQGENNNNNNKTDIKVGATLPLWNLNSDSIKCRLYCVYSTAHKSKGNKSQAGIYSSWEKASHRRWSQDCALVGRSTTIREAGHKLTPDSAQGRWTEQMQLAAWCNWGRKSKGKGRLGIRVCVWGCPRGATSTLWPNHTLVLFCFLNLNTLEITAVRKQKPVKAFSLGNSYQMQKLVNIRSRY